MSHDSPQNGCQAPLGEKQHVMSPHLNSDASPFVWSNCSRGEITKFLDRDWGRCLDDEPSDHEFSFPELPPGAMYDAHHQCRLQFGADAKFCEGIEDVCQTLWCRQENKCVTRLEPAAEGTLCDKNMWCHMGECTVISDRPNSIDGEWGEWSAWSECSRSCGAGVQNSERYCNNPSPAWGGRFCIGERKRYKICNIEKCPENSPSYRAVQCQRFNMMPYKGETHSWLPVSTPMTPCQLHCKPDGQFFSVMLADAVEDGTECNPGTRDICINGKCRRVACDWGIDSKALEDRCGVCHGDGTQCRTVSGEFNQKTGLGYVDVVSIPQGARNIRVEEVSEATNYIAVKADNGHFFLNGQWFIQWSGEYPAIGTILFYQRDGEKEVLQIPGPISERIHILLLYQTENPGLVFEFSIPNSNASRKPEFHWEYFDWTICSQTCGGGMQTLTAKCVEKESGRVEEAYCDPQLKPLEKTRICNKHQCPAKWWTGPWQHCSVTCGGHGMRYRTVICIRSISSDEQIALHDAECPPDDKPEDHETCQNQVPCKIGNTWDAGQWSDVCQDDPCNYQSRHVSCKHPLGKCEENVKPATRRQCRNVTCGNWVVGNWSQCSVTCGEGIRLRNVTCVGGVVCHKTTEPPTQRRCNNLPCSSNTSTNEVFDEDDFVNWISEDDVMLSDLLQDIDNQRRKGRNGEAKSDAGLQRPKNVAKDLMYYQTVEIENPQSENISRKVKNRRLISTYPSDDELPITQKYFWKVNNWSQCSEQCDGGNRNRKALCMDVVTKYTVVDSLCDPYVKPRTSEVCNTRPCLEWIVSEWSQCSVKCGIGVKHRQVYCPQPSMCNPLSHPFENATCGSRPCHQWVSGPWSQCTSTCGSGTQIRQIKCINAANQTAAKGCNLTSKPVHRQDCNSAPCPPTISEFKQCKDIMDSTFCKSVAYMCNNFYFKSKCCSSCNKIQKLYKIQRAEMKKKGII